MSQLQATKKHIACLESLWDSNLESRLSVTPVLELASKLNSIKVAHLTCNTRAELEFNLDVLGRRSSYKILYLAFHGNVGTIQLRGDLLTIEDLAEIMGQKFCGWTVHFGTCSTIKATDERLNEFIRQTQVALITGYEKNVDWIEGAAMELLLFSILQKFKTARGAWNYLEKYYGSLITKTGFNFYGPLK